MPDQILPAPFEPAEPPRGMRALLGWFTRSRKGPPAGRQSVSASDLRTARATFREMLAETGGEASARKRVVSLAALYRRLDDDGRHAFLEMLATEFGPDELALNAAIQKYLDTDPKSAARRRAESKLRQALASPRVRILRQFNLMHDGVKFLVDMRADLLRYAGNKTDLSVLDDELYSLFANWFDIGNLELRRISWNSPAALLEKLIKYEAVHEIRSWNDLRNRLDADRRCYAFFHPRMPDEPLIFVEVALTREMADNVHLLLDESAPAFDAQGAQAAIFYSISNTQTGLRGVSFGGFLIKRVVEELLAEMPKLKVFATLSPVPGFRRWLDERLQAKDPDLFGRKEAERLCTAAATSDPHEALGALIVERFVVDGRLPESLRPVLENLCARYLVEAKHERLPLDPVARFHLGNGARLERINWLADMSPRGVKQSAGLMVNYLYKLSDIEDNLEAFAKDGTVVISDAVKRMLRKPA